MARMHLTYRYSVANHAAFYRRRPLPMLSLTHGNAGCTETHCIIYDVDTPNHVTRYTNLDCSCPFMGLPLEEILELLRQGRVPILF